MRKGMYISIEGPNGSGKSTLAKKIFHLFRATGIPVTLNTQPTKKNFQEISDFVSHTNPFGTIIREIIERRTPDEKMITEYFLGIKNFAKICPPRFKEATFTADVLSVLFETYRSIVEGKKLVKK